MTKIVITTESASDLNETFTEKNIPFVSLFVTLGESEYQDSIDINSQMIFDFVNQTGKLPITAAVGIESYYDFFKRFTDEGNAVIHISISDKISSSYQNALVASKRLPNVTVIDGKTLSSGTGFLVLRAIALRDSGASYETIIDSVVSERDRLCGSFIVDTMEYLYKGGRCSGLSSIVASILKIKPVLALFNGEITVWKKFVGSLGKLVNKYIDTVFDSVNNPDLSFVTLTHSIADPSLIQAAKDRIIYHGVKNEDILTTIAGSTITSHCGKGTYGMFILNK